MNEVLLKKLGLPLIERMNEATKKYGIRNLIDGPFCKFRTGDRVRVREDVGKGLFKKEGYIMGTNMVPYHNPVLFDDDTVEVLHYTSLELINPITDRKRRKG